MQRLRSVLLVFLLLQVLDVLTTLWGFQLGGAECNPMIAGMLPHFGPVGALVAVKLFALSVGALYYVRRGVRQLLFINTGFGLVVLWNVGQLAKAL